MTSLNKDIAKSKKIREAFAELCSAKGINAEGALSVSVKKHSVTITLDTSDLLDKVDDLWIKVPTIKLDLENAGVQKDDIKIDWKINPKGESAVADLGNRSGNGNTPLFPARLEVKVWDNGDLLEKIEAAKTIAGDRVKKRFTRPSIGAVWGRGQ